MQNCEEGLAKVMNAGKAGAYVWMGHIRLFLPHFWPLFRRCFAVFSRCPASWRQDGENGPKTAENGRKMAKIVVSKHPVSYVYSCLGERGCACPPNDFVASALCSQGLHSYG